MSYRLVMRPAAGRQLESLPRNVQVRVAAAIDGLVVAPQPHNVRKLAGSGDLWRVRVGVYRVIYAIDDTARLVTITRIGHRRDVYR